MTADGELYEEDDSGELLSLGGIAAQQLGLQVVATQRRVGEALRVDSTEDDVDGWWHSPVNRGGSREWRVERAGWRECGGGRKGKTMARRAPFIDVQNCKFETDAFCCSKNSKYFHETRLGYCEQLSQLCRFQIPNRNNVKIVRTYSIFESSMNFKGVQTFRKNLINSPKFSLEFIFTIVNLVGHTCM
jgi:hypothetical protein